MKINKYVISENDLLSDIQDIKKALDKNRRAKYLINKKIAVDLIGDDKIKEIEDRQSKENRNYFKRVHGIEVIIKN